MRASGPHRQRNGLLRPRGQHLACTLGWYYTTRPATETEYAALKRELEGAPFGYRLKVYQRMDRQLRDRFMTEVRRLNQPIPETV